jgi:molybdenum cofactor guanylyltransferase
VADAEQMIGKSAQTAALILAGGQATRLGGAAKGAVQLKSRPLAEYVAEILGRSADVLAINTIAEHAKAYAEMGFPLVLDDPAFLGRGPLGGLLAGLEWAEAAGAERLLTAPCDAPFLPPEIGETLLTALGDDCDAAIAATSEGRHNLCAAWRTGLAGQLRGYLMDPTAKLAVKSFLATLRVAHAIFPHETAFLNINTLEDLRDAEAHLA